MLHVYALNGPDDDENMKIISKGGGLAVRLAISSYKMEIDDEEKQPRNPKNIHKYLVDESLPEYFPKHLPANASEVAEDAPEHEAARAASGASNIGHSNIIQEDIALPGAPISPNNTSYIKQEILTIPLISH